MKLITNELYNELLKLTDKRSKHLHNELKLIEDYIEPKVVDTLTIARETKTRNKKEEIKKAIRDIANDTRRKPTKYQIHQKTGIAYQTLNKYYDEIIEEI